MFLFAQEPESIFLDLSLERRAFFFPVGQQFGEGVGLEDIARKNMRSNVGALLDEADAEVFSLLLSQLPQADARGEPWEVTGSYLQGLRPRSTRRTPFLLFPPRRRNNGGGSVGIKNETGDRLST